MAVKLKKLGDQVIVITGASSGIGLSTARMAARRGARVVLAARSEEVLLRLEQEISASGGRAAHIAADVSNAEDVERIAGLAKERFGGFDTWVNDAGLSVYGRIRDVPVDDERELFEVNYWGVVYGSRTAVDYLKDRGGAVINIGSVASDRAIPLQSAYSASKHAVKAFTDALRTEMEKDGLPVSVTLIKPTAIDTPFFRHAKTYMKAQPVEPSPMYAPEAVAKAILYAAEHPVRDLLVGDTAPLQSIMGRLFPRLGDKYVESTLFEGQKSLRPAQPGENRGIEQPSGSLRERGGYPEVRVFERSLYTEAATHPGWTAAVAVGVGAVIGAIVLGARKLARV